MNIHFSPLTASPALFARPVATSPRPASPTSASSAPLVVHTSVAHPVAVGKAFTSMDAAREYLDVYARGGGFQVAGTVVEPQSRRVGLFSRRVHASDQYR
jgi:hypothetical protein